MKCFHDNTFPAFRRLRRTMPRLQSEVRIVHVGLVLQKSLSGFTGFLNVQFLPVPRAREDFYWFILVMSWKAPYRRAESSCNKHNTCMEARVWIAVRAADGVVFSCKGFIFGLLSRTHKTIKSVITAYVCLYYWLFSPADALKCSKAESLSLALTFGCLICCAPSCPPLTLVHSAVRALL